MVLFSADTREASLLWLRSLGGKGAEVLAGKTEKGLISGPLHKAPLLTFYRDVLNGKAEDDGPDHAQGHLQVPVNNFCQGEGSGLDSRPLCPGLSLLTLVSHPRPGSS